MHAPLSAGSATLQQTARLPGKGCALAYARFLLAELGIEPRYPWPAATRHPALAWGRSGMMALTGRADGEPRMCPVPLAACADGALLALGSLSSDPDPFAGLQGTELLAERAALLGLRRQGAVSPGGSCRLLSSADGLLAVNLGRDEDFSLLPAWLESSAETWADAERLIALQPCRVLVERARWLGLAVAPVEPDGELPGWCQSLAEGPRRSRPLRRPARVVDLSSLWAGPLCGRLLQALGAEVVKVESLDRPDGARRGPPAFFDAMNGGKASLALDFRTDSGRRQLGRLLEQADIVIEASRPRALLQLGIDAGSRIASRPGLTWISLTGHGRSPPQDQWIAYGDDAGVAGGLTALLKISSGEDLFCGDAIGDPLSGLHAALAGWATHLMGGGRLLSVALRSVVGQVAGFGRPMELAELRSRERRWRQQGLAALRVPEAASPPRPAASLGANTAAVLKDWGCGC